MATGKGKMFGDGHERPAANISTLDSLRTHLCDLVYDTKKRREKDLRPERCAQCESPCCYGQKLIELMRERGIDYAPGRTIYQAGEIALALRDAPVETDIRRVLRRRTRSAHK